MRLLLDEMYPRRLAEQLRADGHDVVTENVVDHAPLDPADHPGLLLVNSRRWPRTPSGLPRLSAALRSWLGARADRTAPEPGGAGLVEWL